MAERNWIDPHQSHKEKSVNMDRQFQAHVFDSLLMEFSGEPNFEGVFGAVSIADIDELSFLYHKKINII